MSTAKKTLYAAIGAGTTVLTKAREIPAIVVKLPETLKAQKFTLDLRELPKQVRAFGGTVPARATDLVAEARKASDFATKQVEGVYSLLTKRGETLTKKVQNSAPTKRATAQTKTAKTKVKAAATSVKKAAVANVDAAKAVVEKADEATA